DPHKLELNAGNQRVTLHATKANASALFEHEWARARIEYLEHKLDGMAEPDATPVRDMLVDLSVRHRVLSDATAWVVLQSQADYDRHAIARSAALPMQGSNGVLRARPGKQAVAPGEGDDPWLHEPQYGARESARA